MSDPLSQALLLPPSLLTPHLDQLFLSLPTNPTLIFSIYPTIITLVTDRQQIERHEIAAKWAEKVFSWALGGKNLIGEVKERLATQSISPIARLLASPSTSSRKLGLQSFASIYPLLFKHACLSNDQQLWTHVLSLKMTSIGLWRNGTLGEKILGIKVIQRIIQTQTMGSADPRLQRLSEPSLSLLRPNHPFLRPNLLSDESSKLLEDLITTLFTSSSPLLISTLTTSLCSLVKMRQMFGNLVVTALVNWAPDGLREGLEKEREREEEEEEGSRWKDDQAVRSTEKTIRISLMHLLKTANANSFASQITDYLSRQSIRMEQAYIESRRLRDLALSSQSQSQPQPHSLKRIAPSSSEPESSKRRRVEERGVEDVERILGEVGRKFGGDEKWREFDVRGRMGVGEVVELLVESLERIDRVFLGERIEDARRALSEASKEEELRYPSSSSEQRGRDGTPDDLVATGVKSEEKDEVFDPLKLDLGEEELDMKAEVPLPTQNDLEEDEEEESEDHPSSQHPPTSFSASSSSSGPNALLTDSIEGEAAGGQVLSSSTKTALVESAMRRICAAGTDGIAPGIWAPLVARLITRGLRREDEGEGAEEVGVGEAVVEEVEGEDGKGKEEEEEEMNHGVEDTVEEEGEDEKKDTLRRIVFEFVVTDFQSRMEFARLWLNEEWFVEKQNKDSSANRPYDKWLRLLLDHMITFASNKDKGFAQFLIDLPELPEDEIGRLGDMCTNRDQFELGFVALRDLAMLRPPARGEAVDVLLSLATHAERATRLPAVNTVKRWYPDSKALGSRVVDFAVTLLKRLDVPPPPPPSPGAMDMEMTPEPEEEGTGPVGEAKAVAIPEPPRPYAKVKDGQVIDRLGPPTTMNEMMQHVDLYFALCQKDPDLLDHLFRAYPTFQPYAQNSVKEMITPLIKSLGIAHPKISDLVRNCPAGADLLLVRVLFILLEKLRPPKNIIEDIKYLATQREMSPRLYVMVIADFSKPDIIRYLPKVVTLLNNTPEEKAIVRSAFLSVIAPPGQAANVPRSRQADQLMPVELITVLHKSEAVAGVKSTIEAIGICFSMPDAFRPEILASFMTQVVELPVLPVLFLRTVIQAVNTYKTLSTFVSATLLPRLIAKEVWNQGPSWEGFIRLAKTIQPHSLAALCLLPTPQLEDFVTKQPAMKEVLRDYVWQKMTGNPAKSAALLEVLGGLPTAVVDESVSAEEALVEPEVGGGATFA